MNTRVTVDARSDRAVRRLFITALLLTLAALLLGLLFVYRTTGGTLFLFSAVAPVLVMVAISIFVGVVIYEFRQSHRLFFIEELPPGRTVFRQGDPGDCAYFIRSGEVEVIDEETGTTLRTLTSGEYFGEIALIADAPRSATIRTLTAVELAVLGKQNFLSMLKLMPTTEEEILETVQMRVMADSSRD